MAGLVEYGIVEANEHPPKTGIGGRGSHWHWKPDGWHLRIRLDDRRGVMLYAVPTSSYPPYKPNWFLVGSWAPKIDYVGVEQLDIPWGWLRKPDALEAAKTLVATAELMGLL